MIKYAKYLLLFICFILITSDVQAAVSCSNSKYKELGQIASYVKASYEIVDNSETKTLTVGENSTTYKVPNYAFVFTIYNINENIYIDVLNEHTENSFRVLPSDAKTGVYSFEDYDIGTVYNYKFTVYSNDDACVGKLLRTIRVTKPKYNAYSEYTYCENSSSYYCQRFITGDLAIDDTAEFLSKIKVNNEKNNPNKDVIDTKDQVSNILKDNWKIYLIIFVAIAGATTGLIIYKKRANKKKGWKL